MKKIIHITFVTLLLLTIIAPKSAVTSSTSQSFVIVNTDAVNFRTGPSTSTHIIERLNKGTYLLLLETAKGKDGETWYKVYNFNSNKTGYIAGYLVNKSPLSITGEDAKFTVKVSVDALLNVRAGPGTEFNIVKRLSSNTKIDVIRIIKRSDGQVWYKYKDGDKFYFVASWYTKKIETTTLPTQNQNTNTSQNKISMLGKATDFVNLRDGPSTDYKKITLISSGNTINIVGFAKNHKGELWLQCIYNGTTGFVISDYIAYDTSKVSLDLSSLGTLSKSIDTINLREGPGIDYKTITTITKDNELAIVGIALDKNASIWYEVKYNDGYYWVRQDTISFIKKEKGILKNTLWKITADGIDINITGEKLPTPNIKTLEDPIRLVVTYENTNLLNTNNQYELNIFPFTRVSTAEVNENTIVTIYLTSEIPFKFEINGNTHILHFTLPKINEELVEIGGSVVFVNIKKTNTTYISLDDFLNYFNLKLDSDYKVNFFNNPISIEHEDLLEENDKRFISLSALSKSFNVSILQTNSAIYIDPILTHIEKNDKGIIFTFTFPVKAKKIEEGNGVNLVFYADSTVEYNYKSIKRDGITPPQIYVPLDKNDSVEVKDNVVTINKVSQTKEGVLSNRIIIIDPGHGSYSGQYLDVGATGYSGTKEAYIVLDIALRLKKLLENAGAKVILTHDTVDNPNNPTLKERAILANSSGGDLFISIHLNSSINNDANGTETYYWYDSSKRLAQTIQDALVSSLGTYDRGIKKDYLYVCREVTTMPAILTEIGFISNPKEEALFKDPNFLDKVAQALLKGIVRYISGE
uniref:N-acetylmuramoyl-L-alanine amidase n=1 Tax=Caldisericum exile TaxID=693075 RepID=A0A7C4Y673_9BACT